MICSKTVGKIKRLSFVSVQKPRIIYKYNKKISSLNAQLRCQQQHSWVAAYPMGNIPSFLPSQFLPLKQNTCDQNLSLNFCTQFTVSHHTAYCFISFQGRPCS